MQLSEFFKWDSDFFGVNIGKTLFKDGISDYYDDLYDECQSKKIDLLYHFQNTANKKDLIFLNSRKLLRVDERIELGYVISGNKEYDDIKDVSEFNSADDRIEFLYDISEQIYIYSRFCYDPILEEGKCSELYRLWIYNGLYNNFCDKTFVVKNDNKIIGFIMLKINKSDRSASLSLIGVDKEFRSKGLGSKLISKSVKFLLENGCDKFTVVTQARNIGAINLYMRNGFKMESINYVYHIWI